jgi:uroporphyrinogen III methyltransferase/synthase
VTSPTGDAPPLAGRRVLVTRPRAQAAELVQLLETAGATVVVAPTIRIAPPTDREPLLRAAANISMFDWIVFSSGNAVDALLDAMAEANRPAFEALTHENWQWQLPRVCAVGSRTAERLRERGIAVALVPAEFRAEVLVEALNSHATVAGASVLLPRSEIGRDVIAHGLRAAGALVTDVIAYRTVAEAGETRPDVARLLNDGLLDAVTFTSGSSVRNFVQIYGSESTAWLTHTVVTVIGPVTAEAARELGIPVQVQPAVYTAASMVEALIEHFASVGRTRSKT